MKKKKANDSLVTDIVIIAFCLLIFTFSRFFSLEVVSGQSMEPSYHDGDLLVGAKAPEAEEISRGDVVVVEVENGRFLVKRVVAVPGDSVRISDGILYVNDEPDRDNRTMIVDAGIAGEPLVMGPDEYFVLGDNRNASEDSRTLGPILFAQIRGRVLFKIF